VLFRSGLVCLAGTLVSGSGILAAWALVLLGGAYGLALAVAGSGIDAGAPLVAAGLLLAAELAFWSLEARSRPLDPGATARRLAALGLLALAALGIGSLVLLTGDVRPGGGLVLEAAGVVAAAAAVALVARLAQR
jgi:hypothetical protein